MKVAVVGAGLGGLSAAAHLAQSGHDVVVVERESTPGGRTAMIETQGFRLDIGPAVLTMPDLLDDTFAAAGASMAEYVRLRPVDPMYRAVYADGSTLYVRHGREAMSEEIESFAGAAESEAFGQFCVWLERVYRAEMNDFIDTNFDSPLDVLGSWRSAAALVRLGGLRRLAPKVASFFADERLRRIFSFQSMYAGLAPHEALAIYAVITYMDSVRGVFAPDGGMHVIATGLAAAIEDAGVEFRYSSPVSQIERRADGSVRGVRIGAGDGEGDGTEIVEADAVVCNADLPVAYRDLLDGVDVPRRVAHGRYSPSCLLWVAGVRGLPEPGAARHNIHFGADWDGSFRALLERGVPMPDPSMLVTMHSRGDRSLAPEGCSTLYALEPMPNLDGTIDWPRERERLTDALRRRTASFGYPTDVVVEHVIDPRDWQRLGMERGTPFALAHTWRQTGPLRPDNVTAQVPGLVFVGSSTRPGVGVPMVLISGKLAAARVDQYARAARGAV